MAHPRRPVTRPDLLEKVRGLCLGLPEATEKSAWGGPTFRVRDRMFAMYMDHHHGDGRVALWVPSDAEVRDALVAGEGRHFFVPPYMGPRGWLGARLDRRLAWRRVVDIVETAYRRVAPKRLGDQLG